MKKVSAQIYKADSQTAIGSKKILDDFAEAFGADKVIYPSYDPDVLNILVEESNVIPQCVTAYERNIFNGWELKKGIGVEEKELTNPLALGEKERVELLLSFTGEHSLIKNLKKVIVDRERTGTGFLEVIRNPLGEIAGFSRVPQSMVRLLKPEKHTYERTINTPYGEKKFLQARWFYRFAQLGELNNKVFFKEFGDPREMDYQTGEFDEGITFQQQASEILMFKIDTPRSAYGIPRYIGNVLSILGSRKSELMNYYYFVNGKHVPLAILVEGGMLTETALANLEAYLTESKGVESAHSFLLLEAEPEEGGVLLGDDKKPAVRIKFEKLTDVLQKDALFVEYDKENRRKIRSSFQLPPIITGETDDYTRATANESGKVAEVNVFRPLRREIEEAIDLVLQDMNISCWQFGLKDKDVKDRTAITAAVSPFFDKMSFNQIQQVLAEVLPSVEVIQIDEDWANTPLFILNSRLQEQPEEKPEEGGVEKQDKSTAMAMILTDVLRELRENENHT